MKNKLTLAVIIMTLILIFLSWPSLGIETEKCKECHGKVIPIPSNKLTKDCMTCHGQHTIGGPSSRVPDEVHDIHGNNRKISDKKVCQGCHRNSPIECENCHNSHENISSIKITSNMDKPINVSICTDCHGKPTQPKGHGNFRDALSNSKHTWMNCRTCHLNKADSFELNFKNLLVMSINDSINLCKICHSIQYKGLKENIHGDSNKTCIECHNPHTTKLSGPKIQITPKEEPINMSTRVEFAENWITTKVPILKNTTALLIIIIIIVSTVAEHYLSKDEKGKKTAYHTIKVRDNEDDLKTLEIKLNDQNINPIREILERNGANILGMTMSKEEDKGLNTYKYVIFINTKLTDEIALIDIISAGHGVMSAVFTDRYEL